MATDEETSRGRRARGMTRGTKDVGGGQRRKTKLAESGTIMRRRLIKERLRL